MTKRKIHSNKNISVATLLGISIILITVGCLGVGFDIDLFEDKCESDSDCPPGFGCDGFLGRSCVRRCLIDSECPSNEYCDNNQWFQRFSQCRIGCRRDEQCTDSGEFCVEGSCEEGCRENEHCPKDQACFHESGFGAADYFGSCAPGCRNDRECRSNELCIGNICIEDGCRSDADCTHDHFCPGPSLFSSSSNQCEPIPVPVNCGVESCTATRIATPSYYIFSLEPCCPVEEPNRCGLDVSEFGASLVACQIVGQAGVIDSECPDLDWFVETFPGCRRDDGRCGVDAGVLFAEIETLRFETGLGCLLVK